MLLCGLNAEDNSRNGPALSTRWGSGQFNERVNGYWACDVSRRDDEHRDDGVLDNSVRGLFVIVEHEETYHEEGEIYA